MEGYCIYCGVSLGTAASPDGICSACREKTGKGACVPVASGWECPRCGKILAPWMSYCDCPPRVEATYSSNTGSLADREIGV